MEKFKLADKTGFKLSEKRREKRSIPAPQPTPIYRLSMPDMVWNISLGQLGLSAWLCSLKAPASLRMS